MDSRVIPYDDYTDDTGAVYRPFVMTGGKSQFRFAGEVSEEREKAIQGLPRLSKRLILKTINV
jgi:hypothetical protein